MDVKPEAKRIAGLLGITLEELQQGKATVQEILQVLRTNQTDEELEVEEEELEGEGGEGEGEEEVEEKEDMILIKRLAKARYIPKQYVDEARHLLFPADAQHSQ